LSILLTALGIFGAVAFFVGQSAREIGIRAALGATPPSLVRFVLERGMAPALTGLSVGVALALMASRLLRSLFAGLHPWDPATFILSLLLVLGVGGVAALLPALWAVRRSPISNLHGS
jgi:putative ABC transport system permease protein